jgi:hypothetical protein
MRFDSAVHQSAINNSTSLTGRTAGSPTGAAVAASAAAAAAAGHSAIASGVTAAGFNLAAEMELLLQDMA